MARRPPSADGRGACEARDIADHGPPALVLARRRGFARPGGMIQPKFLFAAAAVALAASPLTARAMTARDMQSMHRIGTPEVSPDGRLAVFTVSDTDWEKNKRNNTLHTLDL